MESFIKNLNKYSNEDELFEDLSKFITVDRSVPNFKPIFQEEYIDPITKILKTRSISYEFMKDQLMKLKVFDKSVWEILNNPDKKFRASNYKIFRRYRYKLLDNYDEKIISNYLNLIYEVLANKNKDVYEYILNWISFIIQNHNQAATSRALVLRGEDKLGKKIFVEIIRNLFMGCVNQDKINIDNLDGTRFSRLRTCLLIMKDYKNTVMENKDKISNLIIPNRFNTNVILISNFSDEIKYEVDPLDITSWVYKFIYPNDNNLTLDMFINPDVEFYDNLLTFFMKRDISSFRAIDFY